MCFINLFKRIQAHCEAKNRFETNKALKPATLWIDQFISKIKSLIDYLLNHRNRLAQELQAIERQKLEEEIPDQNEDPELYELLTKIMIHGPCTKDKFCMQNLC